MEVNELLHLMIERDASDVHLKVGRPPGLRIHGELIPLEEIPPLTPEDTERFTDEITTEEQKATFATENELDLAYSVPGLSRFRVNLFKQRDRMGAVLRAIPIKIKTESVEIWLRAGDCFVVPPQIASFLVISLLHCVRNSSQPTSSYGISTYKISIVVLSESKLVGR